MATTPSQSLLPVTCGPVCRAAGSAQGPGQCHSCSPSSPVEAKGGEEGLSSGHLACTGAGPGHMAASVFPPWLLPSWSQRTTGLALPQPVLQLLSPAPHRPIQSSPHLLLEPGLCKVHSLQELQEVTSVLQGLALQGHCFPQLLPEVPQGRQPLGDLSSLRVPLTEEPFALLGDRSKVSTSFLPQPSILWSRLG